MTLQRGDFWGTQRGSHLSDLYTLWQTPGEFSIAPSKKTQAAGPGS